MLSNDKKEKFGLLGKSLSHSFSPIIHAELAEYVYSYDYTLFEKSPDELEVFFTQREFKGINVTIPYKKEVLPYCGSLSNAALETGSVNTIIKKADEKNPEKYILHGDNTDCYGFSYLLRKLNFDFSNSKILVFGDGGSSLAVRTVLLGLGHKNVITVSRKGPVFYSNVGEHIDAVLLINTTPLGMYPNNGESVIESLELFRNCKAVIDLIYNPSKTKLLLMAEENGILAINGLGMLVAQAKRSSELFTGKSISEEKIESICAKISATTQNIILIGMPGCGKTSIGKKLSEIMDREFVDIDEYIKETEKKEAKDIINEEGEEYFRKIETNALLTVCKRSGIIIASGGGIVTQNINKPIIKQNGIVIYLNRDISLLSVEGRPLSLKEGLASLAEKRLPLYSEWSDITLDVTEINETALIVKSKFLELINDRWKQI